MIDDTVVYKLMHIGDRLITSGYSLSGRLFPCWRKARLLAGTAFPGPARTANSRACTCAGRTSTLTSHGAILSKWYSIMRYSIELEKAQNQKTFAGVGKRKAGG